MIDFAGLKVDALLVSSRPNVRYLSGFTGSNGWALLSSQEIILFTDPRYDIQARAEAAQAQTRVRVKIAKKPLWLAVIDHLKRNRALKRIGFEQSQVTYEVFQTMDKDLPLGQVLKPIGPVIDTLRLIKTDAEIARIRRAVQTNSDAFAATVKGIRPGMPEAVIAADLDYQMRKHGAEGTAFETIVATGERTALPHARPSSKLLNANELLLIDMGSAQDGYMSDMTRMLFTGKPPKQIRTMYRSVLDAQLAAVDAVREGATTRQVDRAARDVLKTAGLDKQFVHSTGHGLGLEIHEAPRVGKKDKTRLQAGMVITIGPGAYVEGVGGMRVEDTVLVTKTGCEVLTPTPKELIIL